MRYCKVEGCEKEVKSVGYCVMHYKRFFKYGDPLIVKQKQVHSGQKFCSVEGCSNEHLAKGFCRLHYGRIRSTGNPLLLTREQHRMHGTKTFGVYSAMKHRCLNSNNQFYKNYGGRGITVCDRWKNSFSAFFEDMGHPPQGCEIDRIDNDGNYEPGNCRWVTRTVNIRNNSQCILNIEKAREIRIIYNRGGISQRKLASKFGISKSVVQKILANKLWRDI